MTCVTIRHPVNKRVATLMEFWAVRRHHCAIILFLVSLRSGSDVDSDLIQNLPPRAAHVRGRIPLAPSATVRGYSGVTSTNNTQSAGRGITERRPVCSPNMASFRGYETSCTGIPNKIDADSGRQVTTLKGQSQLSISLELR